MRVFHCELFCVQPGWLQRLADIGLEEDTDWTLLASEETVSASVNVTSNFRFDLQDGAAVYFKRYVYRKIRFKHWLQPSKAAVEATGFHELEQLGIPTLKTIAYGERRRFGLLQAAFIATEGVHNTIELGKFLAHQWINMAQTEKNATLRNLQAILVRQLQVAHGAGFFHWDLKLRNILLQDYPQQPRLIWIDCPRSRHRAANNYQGMVTDLTAMARVGCRVLTRGRQMRFLLDYCAGDRMLARRLYRAIAMQLEKRPPRPLWHLLPRDHPEFIRNMKQQ
jgi:tRNA A-37 threonylcarbamoyl transferase component Bud32